MLVVLWLHNFVCPQIRFATACMSSLVSACGWLSAIVASFFCVGAVAAARIIHHRTLASVTLACCLWFFAGIGIVFIALAFYTLVSCCCSVPLKSCFTPCTQQALGVSPVAGIASFVMTVGFIDVAGAMIGLPVLVLRLRKDVQAILAFLLLPLLLTALAFQVRNVLGAQ